VNNYTVALKLGDTFGEHAAFFIVPRIKTGGVILLTGTPDARGPLVMKVLNVITQK
jgi:hypothetical protein